MEKEVLALVLALVVGFTYYFSNKIRIQKEAYNNAMISLAAGVSITYLLLELFPYFTESSLVFGRAMFVSVLVGFISHHIVEKYIYKHTRQKELVKKLTLEENIFSFAYHLIIGIVLLNFTRIDIIQGMLFFLPMMSFTFVSTLPTTPHKSELRSLFLASSTLLGVLLGIILPISLFINLILTGLVLGILLYTIIRHHIPFGLKGRIGYFTIGFIVYAVLIIGSWFL